MKLLQKKNNARGFTIVELLIVIVVIAILAAIVIVAYNGVQQRANNVKMASTVGQYARILTLYASEYGEYPADIDDGSASTLTCLDGDPTCWDIYSPPDGADEAKTATMYTELQKVTNTFPDADKIVMYYSVPPGPNYGFYFTYILDGSGECPDIGGLTNFAYNSTSSAVGGDGDRRCRMGLPTPSEL